MSKNNIIPGVTVINGKKYLIIGRFNVILILILGIISMIIGGILQISTMYGAFWFGMGLASIFISLGYLRNAYMGFRNLK